MKTYYLQVSERIQRPLSKWEEFSSFSALVGNYFEADASNPEDLILQLAQHFNLDVIVTEKANKSGAV